MWKTIKSDLRILPGQSEPAPSVSTIGVVAATLPPLDAPIAESVVGTKQPDLYLLQKLEESRRQRRLVLVDLGLLYQDLREVLLTRLTQGKAVDRLERQLALVDAAVLSVENSWPLIVLSIESQDLEAVHSEISIEK